MIEHMTFICQGTIKYTSTTYIWTLMEQPMAFPPNQKYIIIVSPYGDYLVFPLNHVTKNGTRTIEEGLWYMIDNDQIEFT